MTLEITTPSTRPPRPLRILQVTNSLNFGGLERLVVDLCLHCDRTLFTPEIACLAREGSLAAEARAAGIPVHLLGGAGGRLAAHTGFARLRRLLRERQIDVLHTHNTGPLLDALLARLTQRQPLRVVHTDHTRPRWPDRAHRMLLERWAARQFGGMVAVSAEAREQLVRHEKIPGASIQVIDNGIDVARFAAPTRPTAEWLAEVDAAHFSQRVGVVAMLREQKGLPHLLAAIPAVLRQHPGTGFLLAGGGPLEPALREQARALGIEHSLRFLGRRSDVVDVLHALDIYILPSQSEGLPLALLEAMAARRCIVATRVGAMPQVLAQGQCGRLIPPGQPAAIASALNELLADPAARTALADQALARVSQQYSIAATVARYQALYLQRAGRVIAPPAPACPMAS